MIHTIHKILLFSCFFLAFAVASQAQEVNDLLTKLSKSGNAEEQRSIHKQLAYLYQKQGAYAKSSEYFRKAISKEEDKSEKVRLLQSLSRSELALGKNAKAIQALDQALALSNDLSLKQTLLSTLVRISANDRNFKAAEKYNSDLLKLYDNSEDKFRKAEALNNMGVLLFQSGNKEEAQQYFDQAISLNEELYKESRKKEATQRNSHVLLNLATLKNYSGNYTEALAVLKKAESLSKEQLRASDLIKAKNLRAVTLYLTGDNDRAENEALEALQLARTHKDKTLLAESHRNLAEIEAARGDSEASQQNFKKFLQLQDEIRAEEAAKQKALLDKQIEIEKRESQMLQLISESKRKALELEQAKLETEKKEQALKLQEQQLTSLERDKELQASKLKNQRLEKQRVQQALALAEAQLNEEKRQSQIKELEQEQKLQSLEIEKRKLKEADDEREKELLRQDKKLKEQEIIRQKTDQFYKNLLLAGAVAALLIVLFFFFKNKRQTRLLAKQNNEIEEQKKEITASEEKLRKAYQESQVMNEELRQTQEELETQRDFVEEQNKKLARSNTSMKAKEQVLYKMNEKLTRTNTRLGMSIASASKIQHAVLAVNEEMNTFFDEHFVINKPYDTVSGDFFRIIKEPGRIIMLIADCTGHGVPGAFMTIIGSYFFDKIVNIEKVTKPGEILKSMHRHIYSELRQERGDSYEGMDAVALVITPAEDDTFRISFAGAKSSLFYSDKDSTIQEMRGTRVSLGGTKAKIRDIEEHEIILPKGGVFYAGSDGIQDQNDISRKRFGAKRLKDLLEKNINLSMEKQQSHLLREVEDYMAGTKQRDDMLWLGVRL